MRLVVFAIASLAWPSNKEFGAVNPWMDDLYSDVSARSFVQEVHSLESELPVSYMVRCDPSIATQGLVALTYQCFARYFQIINKVAVYFCPLFDMTDTQDMRRMVCDKC